MRYTKLPTRESDQLFFVADTSKIKSFINWDPITSKETGIKEVIKWVENI